MAEDEVNEPSATRALSKQKTDRPAALDRQLVVACLALLLSVVAIGAGGYAWYRSVVDAKLNAGQQEAGLNRIERRIDGIEEMQTTLGADISAGMDELEDSLARSATDMREQIQDMRNQLVNRDDSIRQQLQQDINTLSERVAALRSQLDSNLDAWVLAETEQLILIADQRLRFTGETGLAKQALQLAAQRLAPLSGSGVDRIRRLLSTDIAAFDALPSMDVSVLLNELSALSDEVDTLPLAGDIVMGVDTVARPDSEKGGESREAGSSQDMNETGTFGRYLKPAIDAGAALLENLGDMVQVEKDDNPVKPVISAEIRALIHARAGLILESAQVALVREDPAVYSHRINAASRWVERNFNRDAAVTRDWIKRLEQAGLAYRHPGIPDISATLSAIRALARSESAFRQ